MIEPTEDEIDRAFHAIRECMANEAWKIPWRNGRQADDMVRRAAKLAVAWVKNPELAFKSTDSAAAGS